MTPEAWQRIKEVVQAALDRAAGDERVAFLDRVFANEPSLRQEVESLISASESDDEFIEAPAVHAILHQILPKPGDTLGRYRIVEQIGEGAMAVVYSAQDQRLKRDVAIKIFFASVAADPEALARFKREARAVAAISHPNIVALFDFCNDRGIWYAVTELLKGETLRVCLARGPLPVTKVIGYAIQIAKGLAAAHDKGIVHQDLKPENLLVTTNGQVKILDFGVAKVEHPVGRSWQEGDAITTETERGDQRVIAGTLPYMSPEQVRGQAVDHRTDLFAFGTVLYEMLGSRHPFRAESVADTQSAILRDTPPDLAAINRSVSPGLERLVRRCLRKGVSERFQSAGDIRFALERVRDLATGYSGPRFSSAQSDLNSVAVLPFRDMSPGGDQDYFCEGIAEELMSALTKMPGLRVAARTSAFQFKGQAQDVRHIGARLNVAAVLDGSVQKAGNTLRITVELINSADGYHLWSEHFDRDLTDVFEVQDEIASTVVSTLKVKLRPQDAGHLVTPHTRDLEAYDLYLYGRYHWNKRTAEGLKKSAECFQQAVDRDERFAQAYAGMADAYVTLGTYGVLPAAEVMPHAKTASEQALGIDDELAEAYACRGCVQSVYDWSWARAEADFRRAIELNPQYPTAHHWYGINHLVPLGRFDEATEELDQALRLDPLSLAIKSSLGLKAYYAGHFDEAAKELSKTIELDASFGIARFFLGETYTALSRFDEALRELEAAIRLSGPSPEILAAVGYARGVSGDTGGALKALEKLRRLSQQGYVSPCLLAEVHVGLGEKDEALDRLEEAFQERAADLAWLRVRPVFASLHSEPRFVALINEMGFGRAGRQSPS